MLLNLAKIFFIIVTSFCISTNSMWEHLFPHKLVDQRTCCQIGTFVSLIKWNLLVSICLLLVGNKVEKLFLCLRIISPLFFMNCYLFSIVLSNFSIFKTSIHNYNIFEINCKYISHLSFIFVLLQFFFKEFKSLNFFKWSNIPVFGTSFFYSS